MSRPRAVEAGLTFVRALHDASFDDRMARLQGLLAPGATWWIDTGRDRAAGVRGHDPGDARPWPLHGQWPVEDKLRAVARVAAEIFPTGVGARISSRAFGTDELALVEAEGDGLHVSGKRYRNRYAFVFDVSDEGITSIREYLDTLHAEDVFGGDRLSVRTVAPRPVPPDPPVVGANDVERAALAPWPAFARGDLDGFAACFAPGATWWTDSGTDRDRGAFDRSGGPADGWPFHGVLPMDEKLDYIRRRMAEGYGGSTIEVTPVRCFSEGGLVAVEAEGYAALANGRVYQNRYVLVNEVGPDGIVQLREYCDTLHVADATGVVAPTTTDEGEPTA